MQKKIKAKEDVESIEVWWEILPDWDKLDYNKKAEYYWRYEFDSKGNRVFNKEE